MNKIYIITGKTKSGKSTRLMEWALTDKIGYREGIIAPVISRKKYLFSTLSNQSKVLEIQDNKVDNIEIGRYVFDPAVFAWAREQLFLALATSPRFLLIDEIGYLELKGRGLEPAFSAILNEFEKNKKFSLVLVIRETLLEKICEFYQLKNYVIIDDLTQIER